MRIALGVVCPENKSPLVSGGIVTIPPGDKAANNPVASKTSFVKREVKVLRFGAIGSMLIIKDSMRVDKVDDYEKNGMP